MSSPSKRYEVEMQDLSDITTIQSTPQPNENPHLVDNSNCRKLQLSNHPFITMLFFAIAAGFWGGALGVIAAWGGQTNTDIVVSVFLGISILAACVTIFCYKDKEHAIQFRLVPSFVTINVILIFVYWFVWRSQLREINYEFSMDTSASLLPMPTLAVLSQNRSDPTAIILRTDNVYPSAFLGFINTNNQCNDTKPYKLDSTTGCDASKFLKDRYASSFKISAGSGVQNSFFANTTFFVQTFDLQRDILSTSAGQQVVYRVGTQSSE